MKNIILFLALIFVSTPALARGKAHHCYYVTSIHYGNARVESACYRSKATCSFQLGQAFKRLHDKKLSAACFVSRETQSFEVPTWQSKPDRHILPNRASCLESYQAHLAAGDAPTTCHPTESK